MRSTQSLSKEDRARLEVAADWMVRLKADDLDEHLLGKWLAWYDEPANRLAFDEMEVVQEEVRAIDADTRAAFASRFTSAETERGRWHERFRPRTMGWAAAVAAGTAAVAISLGMWEIGWPATEAINAAYQTERGDHREVRLPDRSIVKLGAQSSLSVNFTSDVRYLVLEAGEALFQVERDASRPFVVQAGRLRIRAVGTQFNVRRAEESTFVSVKEGSVEVTRERMPLATSADAMVLDLPRTAEIVRVATGNQALALQVDAPLKVASVAPETVATWQEGRLIFMDESLRSVVATVNRYSAREIVLTDPTALAELRFTGIVMEGRIEEWITAIQEVFPVKVSAAGKNTILVSPTHE